LGNNQDNFQLHRFTTSENIAKSFFFWGGATFLTHTVHVIIYTVGYPRGKLSLGYTYHSWKLKYYEVKTVKCTT